MGNEIHENVESVHCHRVTILFLQLQKQIVVYLVDLSAKAYGA